MLTILRLLLRLLAGRTLRTGDHAWLVWLMSWLVLQIRLAPCGIAANVPRHTQTLPNSSQLEPPWCVGIAFSPVAVVANVVLRMPFYCARLHPDSTENLPLRLWTPTPTRTTNRPHPRPASMPIPATATHRHHPGAALALVALAGPRRIVALPPRVVPPMLQSFVIFSAHSLPLCLFFPGGAQSL